MNAIDAANIRLDVLRKDTFPYNSVAVFNQCFVINS
jgi:hypothetical protein